MVYCLSCYNWAIQTYYLALLIIFLISNYFFFYILHRLLTVFNNAGDCWWNDGSCFRIKCNSILGGFKHIYFTSYIQNLIGTYSLCFVILHSVLRPWIGKHYSPIYRPDIESGSQRCRRQTPALSRLPSPALTRPKGDLWKCPSVLVLQVLLLNCHYFFQFRHCNEQYYPNPLICTGTDLTRTNVYS